MTKLEITPIRILTFYRAKERSGHLSACTYLHSFKKSMRNVNFSNGHAYSTLPSTPISHVGASILRLLLEIDISRLHLLHEPGNVALAEHAAHKRLDLEVFKVLYVFACAKLTPSEDSQN
eukprot:6143149-Pleurochrysis_carterae.AAC.2